MRDIPARIPTLLAGFTLLAGCALQPRPAGYYRMDSDGGLWNHGLHLHSAGTRPLDFTTAFVRIDPQGLHHRRLPFRRRHLRGTSPATAS